MAPDRPNFLLIIQDQLRYDVATDPTLADTPTLDRLGREGLLFERYYTPLGICSPARAALLTGRYPHATGVLNNFNGTDALARNLARTVPTVAESLRAVGYQTGYVGKWHLGIDDGPEVRGFADVRMTDKDLGEDPRFDEAWDRFRKNRPEAIMTRYPPAHPRLDSNHPRIPFPIYSASAVPDSATPARAVQQSTAELLRGYARDDRPFLLLASFIEPHWPNVLPEPYASRYDPTRIQPWPNFADSFEGKPRTNQAGLEHFGVTDFTWQDWREIVARYFGAVSYADALTGELVDLLGELGLAQNTILIVTTDHGDMAGAHRQFNKGPLMYEEVYHIPFFLRWPGQVAGGSRSDRLVSHIDVTPTLLAAAGLPPDPDWHGQSLLPLLRGEDTGWRESLISQFHGDEFGLYSQRMIRQGDFKLVYNPNDLRELYDLATDPYEMHNLAYEPTRAQLRRDLEAELLEQMHATGDPLRLWATNTLG